MVAQRKAGAGEGLPGLIDTARADRRESVGVCLFEPRRSASPERVMCYKDQQVLRIARKRYPAQFRPSELGNDQAR